MNYALTLPSRFGLQLLRSLRLFSYSQRIYLKKAPYQGAFFCSLLCASQPFFLLLLIYFKQPLFRGFFLSAIRPIAQGIPLINEEFFHE